MNIDDNSLPVVENDPSSSRPAPFMPCAVCSGPIEVGEMMVFTDAGVAHRFSTTCKRMIEARAAYQAAKDSRK